MNRGLDQQTLIDYILPFMAPYDTGKTDSKGLIRYRCPHTDHDSDPGDYRIWINENGYANSYCHACKMGGMKLLYQDLGQNFSPECAKKNSPNKFDVLKWWSYTDAYGKELYQIALIDVGKKKPIKRPRHHDPYKKYGWKYSMVKRDGSEIKSTVYNRKALNDLKDKGGLCLYCEGESDAEAAENLRFLSTCHPFGAEAFKSRYVKALAPFDIVIIPDNDPAGLSGALRTASECYGKVKSVKLMDVLGGEPGSKYDLRNWIQDKRDDGLSDEEIRSVLMQKIDNTPYFSPDEYPDAPEPGTKKRSKGKAYDISVDPQYSEEGLAQRLVERHGDKIRFCGDYGRNGIWFYFDGARWSLDCENQVNELIAETIKSVLDDIPKAQLKTEADQKNYEWLQKLVKSNLTAYKIRSIKFCAQGKIPILREAFNKQETTQWILNTQNGMINLRDENIKLLPHDPHLFITQVTPVNYIPVAQAPHFKKFIHEFSAHRPELVEFIQKSLGLALPGNNHHKSGFFFKGEGDTGKTTILEVIMHTLGFDYSHKFNISLICESPYNKSEQVTPELAALHWKRFAVTSEGEKKRNIDVGKFKEMTGSNTQSVNPKFKDPFLSKPSCTMYIDTNDIPSLKNPDQATRNRMVIIPCDHIVIRGQDMDENLFDKLIEEREGILAWLVEGCRKALNEGLNPPTCVKNIIKQYWEKTDIYTGWLNDRDYVIPDEKAVVTTTKAFICFETWCENNDLKPPARNTFRNDMNDVVRYIDGIQIEPVDKIEGSKSAGWKGFSVKKVNGDNSGNNQ